jgi:fluoride exporter
LNLILVMAGGFLGAICRFAMIQIIRVEPSEFPAGTLSINIIGCFLLGWLYSFARGKNHINARYVLFLGTGFIGSFTTFSTFSVETLNLLRDANYIAAAMYTVLSIGAGLVAVNIGNRFAQQYFTKKEGTG